MPVHAVKVETSRISRGTPIPTVVRNVLSGLSTALDGEAMEFKEIDPSDTEDMDERYYAGLYRFDVDDHSAEELLDKFENVLSGPAKWYRLRYHKCSRDSDGGDEDKFPCEWDAEIPPRFGGDVPADLAGPTDPADV